VFDDPSDPGFAAYVPVTEWFAKGLILPEHLREGAGSSVLAGSRLSTPNHRAARAGD
jgi:hypothetical protein